MCTDVVLGVDVITSTTLLHSFTHFSPQNRQTIARAHSKGKGSITKPGDQSLKDSHISMKRTNEEDRLCLGTEPLIHNSAPELKEVEDIANAKEKNTALPPAQIR